MNKIDVLPGGRLVFKNKIYPCAIGKNGVATNKEEGDMATPVGSYLLRMLYYRADKIQLPKTGLKTQALENNDAWCDYVTHEHYNQFIKLPHRGSHENLWHPDDDLYDLIIPIGYNDDPVVPGKGSAIFIHVARPEMSPTAGCVALKKDDLLKILPKLDNQTRIVIHKDLF